MEMFGDSPPPLLAILGVADLWNAKGQRKIEAEVKTFEKRFPQIRWRICAVALGSDVSLPLFGFWLMNAPPAPSKVKVTDFAKTEIPVLSRKEGDYWKYNVTRAKD
ncbi:MAG: hypothetical protein OSA84_04335 [Akkermansiaceae bacterium]|nr:hypothetical protein [Akkermansiaceae bacterium]